MSKKKILWVVFALLLIVFTMVQFIPSPATPEQSPAGLNPDNQH